jgi:HK97 family phage portal protein
MAGLFETMVSGLAGLQAKAVDISDLTWSVLLGDGASKAGVKVNIDTALKVTTVMACTRVLAEGVAQLPLTVGRYDPTLDSVTSARDVRAYDLLNQAPNDWMTSFELRETMMVHAVLCGNAIAVKNTLRGEVRELLPVPWNCVQIQRAPMYGLVYQVNDPYGLVGTFLPKDVVHLRGPSWDAVLGLDAIRLAREAIGLAIATEETHERLFANGARPGGILSIDGSLGKEARDRIEEQSKRFTREDAFRMMVLDKGATFNAMAMSGVDAQHLETRKYQVEEICRALRVFPHMVGYSDKTATFASAESFFQGHVDYSLMPWLERFQQVLKRDVLGPGELVARFDVRGLIRGDTKARAEFYASGIINGWLTRNDARRFEGLPPLPGLDVPLVPVNLGLPKDALPNDPDGQAELLKAAKSAAMVEIKAWLTEHGALPTTDRSRDDLIERVHSKIGRVLSTANEGRITAARNHLNDVLGSLA